MTDSQTMAAAVRKISAEMAQKVCNIARPEDQDTANDIICTIRSLAKLINDMDYEEARETIIELEEPERGQIIAALRSENIFIFI